MSLSAVATPDRELIEAFVRDKSESAFRCLVERHARWMFAAAFRQLRDRQLAEDATQAAFIILLQKAHAMPSNTKFSTWLFSVLQLTVKNLQRSRQRRRFHEFRAAVRSLEPAADPAAVSYGVADHLDAAVSALRSSDRATILLRFYQNLSFDQIAQMLGISEAAARKRTHRAIHVLRRKLGAEVNPESIALGAACGLDHFSAALIHTIATGALTAGTGAAIPATILNAMKGMTIVMATTKIKVIAALFIICFLALPIAIVTISYTASAEPDSTANQSPAPTAKQTEMLQPAELWEVEDISSYMVGRLRPEVKILPTKFPHSSISLLVGFAPGSNKYVGIRATAANMLAVAYHWDQERILFVNGEPQDRYDFVTTMPKTGLDALQAELKSTLGLIAHSEMRTVDVLLLEVKNSNAPGLKPPTRGEDFYFGTDKGDAVIHWNNDSLSRVPEILEGYCKMPITDETGVTQHFSVDVKWKELGKDDPNHDALKEALLNQLGLELVPSRASIQMLVVDKIGVMAPH
jgi:RNA polymerase sigma-70 factor, ECF subfamily